MAIPVPADFKPWQYWTPQPGPQTRALTCPADEVFYGGTRGGGKLQVLQALILTPKGFKALEDIQVGDIITDPTTGGTCKVIQLHPIQTVDIYEVTMDDGAVTWVGLEHLWAFKLPNHRRYRTNTKRSMQRDYAMRELGASMPDERWNNLHVGTTEELIKCLNAGYNPRIPLTEPVGFTVNGRTGTNPALDPYILGILLGDGNIASMTITCCEDEIRDYLHEHGWHNYSGLHKDGKPKYWHPDQEPCRILRRWATQNKLTNCHAWEKFIPKYVKTAPLEYRLSMLQGLMDSDGYVDERGRCYFTSTGKQLARDVQEIVWSLGGKAYWGEKAPTYTWAGEKKSGRKAYDIHIQLKKSDKLFRLTRKKARCTNSWNGGHEMMREIVKIEKVLDKQPARCLSVDSPYGLYVTDDYIVTHNSYTTIGRQIYGALRYAHAWNGVIFRRKYKDFREMRRQWDEIINQYGLPATRLGGEEQPNYIKFANGAMVSMIALSHIDQIADHIGQAYTDIALEEAPEFPFLPAMIDKLKGSLRSAHGVPCRMFFTGNPGGPAASVIKAMFIPLAEQGSNPVGEGRVWRLSDSTTRVFIRSTYADNKILMDNDPGYQQRLGAIKDPNLRAAWRDGRWDVFIGQAFNFSDRHILGRKQQIWPIPDWAPLYMTFDWGYGAPFSVGWWWVDSDDRIYRFAEWYGTAPETPGVGLRMTDPKIAEGIIQREKELGIADRAHEIRRLAGHDSFSKKPDYKGGGQGDSTYHEFLKTGERIGLERDGRIYNLKLISGDVDRIVKIQQFRNRLESPDDPAEMPMLMVYDTCQHFIRTIPSLAMDEVKREDLEDGQEDHCYDDACHICMDRPHGVSAEELLQQREDVAHKAKKAKLDKTSRTATEEFEQFVDRMKEQQDAIDDWDHEIDDLTALDEFFDI